MLALQRQRQEDQKKFKVLLSSVMSLGQSMIHEILSQSKHHQIPCCPLEYLCGSGSEI